MNANETQELNHAIATAPQALDRDGEANAAIAALTKRGGRLMASNCNPDIDDDYNALMLMQLAKPNKINDNINVKVEVAYCMVREWESTDQLTGEVADRLRTVLCDNNGVCWSTNSMAVAECVLTLLKSRNGKARFNPPITLRFSKERTLSGTDAIVPIIDLDAIKAFNAPKKPAQPAAKGR